MESQTNLRRVFSIENKWHATSQLVYVNEVEHKMVREEGYNLLHAMITYSLIKSLFFPKLNQGQNNLTFFLFLNFWIFVQSQNT